MSRTVESYFKPFVEVAALREKGYCDYVTAPERDTTFASQYTKAQATIANIVNSPVTTRQEMLRQAQSEVQYDHYAWWTWPKAIGKFQDTSTSGASGIEFDTSWFSGQLTAVTSLCSIRTTGSVLLATLSASNWQSLLIATTTGTAAQVSLTSYNGIISTSTNICYVATGTMHNVMLAHDNGTVYANLNAQYDCSHLVGQGSKPAIARLMTLNSLWTGSRSAFDLSHVHCWQDGNVQSLITHSNLRPAWPAITDRLDSKPLCVFASLPQFGSAQTVSAIGNDLPYSYQPSVLGSLTITASNTTTTAGQLFYKVNDRFVAPFTAIADIDDPDVTSVVESLLEQAQTKDDTNAFIVTKLLPPHMAEQGAQWLSKVTNAIADRFDAVIAKQPATTWFTSSVTPVAQNFLRSLDQPEWLYQQLLTSGSNVTDRIAPTPFDSAYTTCAGTQQLVAFTGESITRSITGSQNVTVGCVTLWNDQQSNQLFTARYGLSKLTCSGFHIGSNSFIALTSGTQLVNSSSSFYAQANDAISVNLHLPQATFDVYRNGVRVAGGNALVSAIAANAGPHSYSLLSQTNYLAAAVIGRSSISPDSYLATLADYSRLNLSLTTSSVVVWPVAGTKYASMVCKGYAPYVYGFCDLVGTQYASSDMSKPAATANVPNSVFGNIVTRNTSDRQMSICGNDDRSLIVYSGVD